MFDNKPRLIRELFERNKRGLLDYLTRKVGREAAPDLLQDAFVRVLRHDKIDTIVDPGAFLHTTALNLTRDFSRRRETEAKYLVPGAFDDDHPARDAPPDEQLDAKQKARCLLAAVEALPPKCRQVFIMRRFEDLSQDEISDRLGISRNMVEKHLRLALERCRAALD